VGLFRKKKVKKLSQNEAAIERAVSSVEKIGTSLSWVENVNLPDTPVTQESAKLFLTAVEELPGQIAEAEAAFLDISALVHKIKSISYKIKLYQKTGVVHDALLTYGGNEYEGAVHALLEKIQGVVLFVKRFKIDKEVRDFVGSGKKSIDPKELLDSNERAFLKQHLSRDSHEVGGGAYEILKKIVTELKAVYYTDDLRDALGEQKSVNLQPLKSAIADLEKLPAFDADKKAELKALIVRLQAIAKKK